ncbi:hypothetical protein DYGSA30_06280 [Dyella sp. GSA-30]|nr:hypothetical protein DYGSA30_06280 [Dyella sp. GSA-30]
MDDYPGPRAPGISLRYAHDGDLAFFRDIYAQSRAAEVAAMPWSAAVRRAFCDSQFELQHRHYVAHYRQGHFLVVEHDGKAIGRLYVCHQSDELWLVDILIDQTWRGQGIGTALLDWMRELASGLGLISLRLHVLKNNQGARRLYERQGFVPDGAEGAHLRMVRACA